MMTKLNKGTPAAGPFTTSPKAGTLTHQDAPGYSREARSELFLRATTGFAGEKKFYEAGAQHDDRMIQLARNLAVDD